MKQVNHGELVDPEEYELRYDYYQRFKNSYIKTLEPLSEDDRDTMVWHISDLLWAADCFADVFGKAQLRDILRYLMRDESYFSE